ncbi:MAG: flagellar biosynthesis regulator FlaF [Pseudomonadota bacterium]
MYNQAAAQAYQSTSQRGTDPRSLEAQVLVKAAMRLQDIQQRWDDLPMPSSELEDALSYNRKLWTILLTGTTKQDNPLPDNIKSNIVNIANFVFRHSLGVLANPAPEKLNTLISINKNLAEGLRGNG